MSNLSLSPTVDFTLIGTTPEVGFAAEVRTAFERALAGEGKIAEDVLSLPGMSGRKYRRFINNLIELIPNPRYLEIGVWQGSTLCSATFGNQMTATAIDNWSQFDGPVEAFLVNVAKFRGAAKVSFLNQDYREVDFSHIGKFNVYLFDGPHTHEDQYDGIKLVEPALDETFVLVVDDWNFRMVRRSTMRAIRDCGFQVNYAIEVRTTLDNSQPQRNGADSEWHNGYFVAAMKKSANSGTHDEVGGASGS